MRVCVHRDECMCVCMSTYVCIVFKKIAIKKHLELSSVPATHVSLIKVMISDTRATNGNPHFIDSKEYGLQK